MAQPTVIPAPPPLSPLLPPSRPDLRKSHPRTGQRRRQPWQPPNLDWIAVDSRRRPLVLQSGEVQFVVWVQSVGVSGVLFCDTDLQKAYFKPLGFGPKELPMDQIRGVSDISKSLDQNAKQ
jgi:hypothetical protein